VSRRLAASVAVGEELPGLHIPLRRADLVRYAGASGDFNPIHYDVDHARAVGLPDVLAHGMLTMGLAGRALTDWAGDPGAVAAFGVRFVRPVVVPAGQDTAVDVAGVVTEVDPAARTAAVELTVTVDGQKVLGQARALVRLG
jgi:acyl dehydratase